MTKKQAIDIFENDMDTMEFQEEYRNDKPALREAWGNFTDMLCKDGEITQKQYDTWMPPKNLL